VEARRPVLERKGFSPPVARSLTANPGDVPVGGVAGVEDEVRGREFRPFHILVAGFAKEFAFKGSGVFFCSFPQPALELFYGN